jgi:hypothetical protein
MSQAPPPEQFDYAGPAEYGRPIHAGLRPVASLNHIAHGNPSDPLVLRLQRLPRRRIKNAFPCHPYRIEEVMKPRDNRPVRSLVDLRTAECRPFGGNLFRDRLSSATTVLASVGR